MALGVFKALCLLLGSIVAGDILPSTTSEATIEDCGDVQHNVETGMIRLPDFSGESIADLNCSWTYTAPPGRKLLVKVDSVHLPPLDVRSSVFKLYIDDQLFDIPRNCVKCLREMVGGKVIKVLFVSYLVSSIESTPQEANESVSNAVEGIGSFQVRYKAFDPDRCSKPEAVENGFIIGKGRKVGHTILYHCNSPYDLIGEAKVKCVVPESTPVPEWSSGAPKCAISDCDRGPITRDAGSGSIASPGYPTYIYHFTSPCNWEITAELHQQIKVSITYLKLAKQGLNFNENSSVLTLLDGDFNHPIVNLAEPIVSGALNFTTLTNKLIVQFVVNEDNKGKEETGFYLDYVAVPSSCPDPEGPENGEVIAHSTDLGSAVAYRCRSDYVLVGELHAECLLNGKWSHPTPRCELLTVHTEHLLAASNDSDTVTVKLMELSSISSISPASPTKPLRGGKKKAKERMSTKAPPSKPLFEEKETFTVQQEEIPLDTFPFPAQTPNSTSGRKIDKESGPKWEPHLQQVVPPKEAGKKIPGFPPVIDVGKGWGSENVTLVTEQVPPPEKDPENSEGSAQRPAMSMTMIAIIAGVGAPLGVGTVLLIIVLIYRRRYPVRMRFGRKFSTFENPMYVSKDAHHPRELKRLTK